MSIPFLTVFLLAISIVFSVFKTPSARVVTRSTANITSAQNSLHCLPIKQRINFKLATLVHCSLHNAGPQYLSSLLHPYTPTRQLRSACLNLLSQPRISISLASCGFRHAGHSIWNSLPHHERSIDSYTVFKSNLKTHLFSGSCISDHTILSTCFWFDIIMLIYEINYIMLCYTNKLVWVEAAVWSFTNITFTVALQAEESYY